MEIQGGHQRTKRLKLFLLDAYRNCIVIFITMLRQRIELQQNLTFPKGNYSAKIKFVKDLDLKNDCRILWLLSRKTRSYYDYLTASRLRIG